MCALEQAMRKSLESKLIFLPFRVQIYYTGTILLFLVVTSIISLFPPPLGADCINSDDWIYVSLISLVAIETLLMLVLAVIIWKLKRREENEVKHPYLNVNNSEVESVKIMLTNSNSIVSNPNSRDTLTIFSKSNLLTDSNNSSMLERNANTKRFELQVCIMTVFYIFSLVADTILYVLHERFEGRSDFECYKDKYIVVLTNKCASYFLAYNLASFSYTLVMIYTFYYLLKRSGMTI